MTRNNKTRHALLMSLMSILLCIAMLIGSTFAWFTDSASTTVNKIQAGNLNIALYYKDAAGGWQNAENKKLGWTQKTAPDGTVTIVDTEGSPLWEPGCTFSLPELKIVNEGNLALKYKIVISGITGSAKLNEVIDWTMNLDDASETLGTEHNLVTKNEEDIFTISGKMETTAGNEYQGLSIDGIAITVYATQLTSEYDSSTNTYDQFAEYPIVETLSKDVSSSITTDGDVKKLSGEVKVKSASTAVNSTTPLVTVTLPEGTQLDNTATAVTLKVAEVTDTAKLAEETKKITVESNEASRTLEIDLDGINQNASAEDKKAIIIDLFVGKDLNGVKFYHNGTPMTDVSDTSSKTKDNLEDGEFLYNKSTGVLTFASSTFSPFTIVFANGTGLDGSGTEASPYLIKNISDFKRIGTLTDKYYYYKVADGVTEIDCTYFNGVNLNGSFDGNGVTFTNVTGELFYKVGTGKDGQAVTIKNFTANMDGNGTGVVYWVYTPSLTFENVNVSGIVAEEYNVGAFVGYGTGTFGYTLNFKNCTCDATIQSTVNSFAAVLVGHPWSDTGETVEIYVDSATDTGINGATVYAPGNNCYGCKYYGAYTNATVNVYIGGAQQDDARGVIAAEQIQSVKPTKVDGGYNVTAVAGATRIEVIVGAQLTGYAEDNKTEIAQQRGITMNLSILEYNTVTEEEAVEIFKKVNSITVENGLVERNVFYELSDGGEFTVYTNSTKNYITGNVTLTAKQYDADGALLSTGTLEIAKRATTDGTWTVN